MHRLSNIVRNICYFREHPRKVQNIYYLILYKYNSHASWIHPKVCEVKSSIVRIYMELKGKITKKKYIIISELTISSLETPNIELINRNRTSNGSSTSNNQLFDRKYQFHQFLFVVQIWMLIQYKQTYISFDSFYQHTISIIIHYKESNTLSITSCSK